MNRKSSNEKSVRSEGVWPNIDWAESERDDAESILLFISERSGSVILDSSEFGSDVSERPISVENKVVIPTVGHRSTISASAEVKLSLITEADGGCCLEMDGDRQRNRCLSSSSPDTGVRLPSLWDSTPLGKDWGAGTSWMRRSVLVISTLRARPGSECPDGCAGFSSERVEHGLPLEPVAGGRLRRTAHLHQRHSLPPAPASASGLYPTCSVYLREKHRHEAERIIIFLISNLSKIIFYNILIYDPGPQNQSKGSIFFKIENK